MDELPKETVVVLAAWGLKELWALIKEKLLGAARAEKELTKEIGLLNIALTELKVELRNIKSIAEKIPDIQIRLEKNSHDLDEAHLRIRKMAPDLYGHAES